MELVRKLLKKNLSKSQLIGYAFAGLFGLSIVLLGLQFYLDTRPVFSSKESFLKKDFLVISKKVSMLKTLGTSSTAFKDTEIEDLKRQPFVSKLAYFTPSTFQVELSAGGGIGQFTTDLFFESVPDDFLDVETKDWRWTQDGDLVPIILPRSYLSLYNFGFAQSQGLPQISENSIGAVVMTVRMFGRGRVGAYEARIVGFSNKINTILVPQAFMTWANTVYGSGNAEGVSRLLLEVKNPTDPAIAEYVSAKGYEFNDDKLDAGKAAYFLRTIIIVVLAVGVVITLLAVCLLMLSISLLVQKNRSKLENLMLIGYSQRAIAAPYQQVALAINMLVFVLALLIVVILRAQYMSRLAVLLGEHNSISWLYIGIGAAIFVALSLVTFYWIRAKVNAVFKPA